METSVDMKLEALWQDFLVVKNENLNLKVRVAQVENLATELQQQLDEEKEKNVPEKKTTKKSS